MVVVFNVLSVSCVFLVCLSDGYGLWYYINSKDFYPNNVPFVSFLEKVVTYFLCRRDNISGVNLTNGTR